MTVISRQTEGDNPSGDANTREIQTAPEQTFVPYDENLLERARTQWQFGDWQSLARLDRDTFQHHPDRAKLALLAAAGRLQIGESESARPLILLARDWGCSKHLIGQILVAGVYNSLGRICAISGQKNRSISHFERSVIIGSPGADVRLLTQVRAGEQLQQLKFPVFGYSMCNYGAFAQGEAAQKNLDVPYFLKIQFRINGNAALKLGFNTKQRSCFNVDGDVVDYCAENDQPIYLISNEVGGFEVQPVDIQISLAPDASYILHGKISCNDQVSPALWVFQYAGGKKIESHSVSADGGRFRLYFRTLANVEAVSIGIRLAGAGRFLLSETIIQLRELAEEYIFDHIESKIDSIKQVQIHEVQNSMRQIESFMRLQSYLGEDVVLPETHGWPISPDFGVLLINLIEQHEYDAVVEFGSGTSTLILAKALLKTARRGGRAPAPLLSFDHLEEYAEKTKKLLTLAGLGEFAEVALAPLVDWFGDDGKSFSYYDCDAPLKSLCANLGGQLSRVLVVVDGPPAATGKHARYPALPIVLNAFVSMPSIDFLMDDYLRADEQEIVATWIDKLMRAEITHSKTEFNQLEKKACLLHLETCQGKK